MCSLCLSLSGIEVLAHIRLLKVTVLSEVGENSVLSCFLVMHLADLPVSS